jgi:hypothetical protein
MMSSRRSLAIALIALSPLALSACEKPNPGVTVWSGTNSEHVSALCWEHDPGVAIGPATCAQDVLDAASQGQGITAIRVQPGDTVGISVDTKVADAGWSVQIGGQPLVTGLTETYYRFTFPQTVAAGGAGYTMQITAAAKPTGNRGIWFFQLVPR